MRTIFLFLFFVISGVQAAEWSVESDVNSQITYNDNVFLTTQPHDSVTGLLVTPSVKMLVKERNWQTFLDARLRSNKYSDEDLDSNDIYFDLTGEYLSERNTYSLNGALDFDSNLNTESTDFGISRRQVERERRSITPEYTRKITERLTVSISYSYVDVDYVDADNTLFVPYNTDDISGSLLYSVSENDQLSFSLSSTAYESKDTLRDSEFEYDLVTVRIGMNHQLSESFSVSYQVGNSQRDSTSRRTIVFDFFGVPISLTQTTDSSNSGIVYFAGFEKKWLVSALTGSLSQDNATDSFGGLSETQSINLNFGQEMTRQWDYAIRTRYQDIESVSTANQFTNRDLISFESIIGYQIDRGWRVDASYRYTRRKLKSLSRSQAPDSNRLFIGLTYNFPSISTF